MKGLWKHRMAKSAMALTLLLGSAVASAEYYSSGGRGNEVRTGYAHNEYARHDPYEARWEREHHKSRDDYARVLDVDPIYARPSHRQCNKHDRYADNRRGDDRDAERTRVLVGGIAGATIGNLIGREQGNAALGTAIGAAVGAVGASALDPDRPRSYSDCNRYDNLKYDRRPVAYRVTYLHRGQVRVMETREHPGRYVRIAGQGKRG